MAVVDKAFEVDNGIVVNDGAAIISGSGNPTGMIAPVGSLFLSTDNIVWEKFGVLDNEWSVKEGSLKKIVNYELLIPTGTTKILNSNEFSDCLVIDGEGYVI